MRWGGGFPCLPLAGSQHLLVRRQLAPLPDLAAAPDVEGGHDSPWDPRRILKAMSSAHCSYSSQVTGQLSPPTSIPAGESPFPCHHHPSCPPRPHPNRFLPWHGFNFIAHSAKSHPAPQPGGLAAGKQEGSPVPSECPLQRRQDRLRRKGSVLGWCHPSSLQRVRRAQWEVPVHSGSGRPGVG